MTRIFYIFCFTFLATALSPTSSAATLTVSDNLIVSEVDDKKVEHGFISKKSTFTLMQGEHALVVRYKDVFEDLDFAEDRVVESQSFVVKFHVVDEKQLNLTTVAVNNLAQAKSFSKSPELVLKDERNKQIKMELENVSDYKVAKQVDIAVNTYVSKQAIEQDKKTVMAETAVVSKSITPSTNKPQATNILIQVNALAMLKYWWQNASDEEKKHFKQYTASDK